MLVNNIIPNKSGGGVEFIELIDEDITTITGTSYGKGCNNLASYIKKIDIPETVTSIGEYAFYYCSSLTEINIPDTVTSIGSSAFYYCSSLTEINIPDTVTSIGSSAFGCCSSLTEINIPGSVTNMGDGAIIDCSNLTKVVVSEGVTSIPAAMLRSCRKLETLILPYTVTSVGDYALYEHSPTNLTISGDAISFGTNCFGSRSDTQNLNIAEGSTTILYDTIKKCTSSRRLTTVTIPDTVTTIGESAFDGYGALKSVIGANGVTTIEPYAFRSCVGITEINIPNSVTKIDTLSFYNIQVTELVIPNSVKEIGLGAFSDCDKLTNLIILSDDISISNQAFDGCSSLTHISFQGNAGIGSDAFASAKITDVTFLEGYDGRITMNSIGCQYTVQRVTLPKSLTTICRSMFEDCRKFADFIIPDGVTTIEGSAFYGCTYLKSIVIPKSVTAITGDWVFYNCSYLANIYFTGTEEEWNSITKSSNWNGSMGLNVSGGTVIHYNYIPE